MNIIKTKTRKTKASEYEQKYSNIPTNLYGRLEMMCDMYNINDKKMNEILEKKNNMIDNMVYRTVKIVLYELPEGTQRSRFRIINRKNFHIEAMSNSSFVHVYSPNAKDDFLHMKRLVDDDLVQLDYLINTQCILHINSYFPMPSYLTPADKILAEIGLNRPEMLKPDWDNIGKKYSDMYNHNIWLDDATVVDGSVHKFFSILPRVEIELSYLNCVQSKAQLNRIIKRKDYDGAPIQYLNNKGELEKYEN